MTVKAFEVGGIVRDDLLGVKSNDVDYTVEASCFEAMRQFIIANGMKVVVETPEFFTIRAVAKTPFQGRKGGLDFVWARKEGPYSDGRRPDWVRPGTLHDDLARRDFTMNAVARAADGSLVDPFNGVQDIKDGVIRCVGDPFERFSEDALRMVRAVRFKVTKEFSLASNIMFALHDKALCRKLERVSDDRIQAELSKMFRHNTVASLRLLNQFPLLCNTVFSGSVSLDSTMKVKGRG